MKVIFHENQLSYRGTSNALYDYAYFNQEILNNESIILHDRNNKNNLDAAIERFKKEFEVISYNHISELERIVDQTKTSLFYAIKAGKRDGIEVSNCKTVIHTVFKNYDPHGDVYAYVSKWLTEEMTGGKSPYVPHMIHVEKSNENLRKELNIPEDAIVFGRHGGATTFDIKFIKRVVKKIALKRKDVYFLFLGTDKFVFKNIFTPFKNVIFLSTSIDRNYISRFINTCDAYLHARKQGESFGIAIGEFSVKNKPIFTWAKSGENSHLDILGDKAILYENQKDAYQLINDFKPNNSINWDAYSENFSPEKVMEKFKKVFID